MTGAASEPMKYWGNYIMTPIEVNYEIQELILMAAISNLDRVSSTTAAAPGHGLRPIERCEKRNWATDEHG
jgi:hypothetical protein